MTHRFWAHSDQTGLAPDSPGANWQPLAEHLGNVSRLARKMAEQASPENSSFHHLADWCGRLHDYGKYTDCFQRMILTGEGKGKCPHSIHGAVMAYRMKAHHVAFAVAGHHAGMPDASELADRIKKYKDEAASVLLRASKDSSQIETLFQEPAPQFDDPGERFDLLTRMLSSCLVDADRLDTAGRTPINAPLGASALLSVLLETVAQKSTQGSVNEARREILADCLSAASKPGPIFSLSVPTGGGKTLSSMAFALKRAVMFPEHYRRIIVVIPYLSIIEQNAEVYTRIFGRDSILEHHSGSLARLEKRGDHFVPSPDQGESYHSPSTRSETENWDAPLIVTTSVRFFESIFSNHPSDLRRIHNIARSIIIFDEVQVLPKPLLAPLLAVMDELCADWGCSFVLSTATQPAFEKPVEAMSDPRWPKGRICEIARSPGDLHRRLRRVSIEWRINVPVGWDQVAEWILENPQALCIVNVRDHAAILFGLLRPRVSDSDSLFHLSTRMCPAHRLSTIAKIRTRLDRGLACLVVSTQLIEAGVDLDFPAVFRAIGPLDSIIQAAGRADREGRLTEGRGSPAGRLVVFVPLDNRMPPNEYENAAGIARTMALSRDIQPDDLDATKTFFEAWYGNDDLGRKYLEMRRDSKFKTLATEFEMISNRTQDAFIPWKEGSGYIAALRTNRRLTRELRKKLQRYTVGLPPHEFTKAQNSVLSRLNADEDVWIASEAAYSEETGLMLTVDAANLVG